MSTIKLTEEEISKLTPNELALYQFSIMQESFMRNIVNAK